MPTEDWGLYTQGLTVGTEVSSTYEGRHIMATAAELNHGNILGVVTKGYPVIFGIVAGAHGVGVAFNTEVAGTDLIAVDTEGIWNLTVLATDDAGGAGGVVVAGDPLFINTTSALISKIRNLATQIPFGYALGGIAQDLSRVIAVKVHWDPSVDNGVRMDNTVTPGQFGKSMYAFMQAAPASEGLCQYFEGRVDGNQANLIYNVGSWINVETAFVGAQWITPYEGGIYCDAGATMHTVAYAGFYNFQGDATANPTMLCAWHLNVAGAVGAVDAVIHAANAASVGFVAQGVSETTVSMGVVPLFYIVGTAAVPGFVRLYADNL